MGRPIKNGLDYFPVDTDIFEDEKFRHLSAAFGLKGEAIAIRLLCRIYRNGGFIQWDQDEENLFIAPLGRKVAKSEVHGIVEECLKRGFFSRQMFDEFGILTSNGIQRRVITISKHIKRKITIPDSFLISPRETPSDEVVSSQKSTQNKIKENKIKEREIKGTSPAEMNGQPTAEQPAFYEILKTTWLEFYEKNFSAPPSFGKHEEEKFRELLEKMFARMAVTKTASTEENAVKMFTLFLERAFEDHWLQDHFLLSNLLKQFDSILDFAKKLQPGSVVTHIPIAELYQRFLNGTGIFPRITEQHYNEISKRVRITRDIQEKAVALRMKELQGSNARKDIELAEQYLKYPDENPGLGQDSEAYFSLCKRVAVMFYFKQLQEKHLTINE